MKNIDGKESELGSIIKIGVTIAIVLLIVVVLFGTFYIIPAGTRGVLLTFGKPSPTTIDEGLHVKMPMVQSVVKMDVRTQKYEADAAAASKDLQIVSTKIAVNYHLSPDTVPEVYTKIGVDYGIKIIQPAVQEVVKASTAQFTAEELITKRDAVKAKIDETLGQRLREKGIVMETTSITNFDFSQVFNEAIEAKVTAEQIALKAGRDLDRIKIEKEQTITQAEAQAQSTKVKADAEAYALQVVREQLEKSQSLIQYKQVEKWDGKLPTIMSDGAVPIITKAVE